MDFLIPLLVAWIVITLIGHTSFLLIRAVFRVLTGQLPGDRPAAQRPAPQRPADSTPLRANLDQDLVATGRMIDLLRHRGLIDQADAGRWRENLAQLRAADPVATPLSAPTTGNRESSVAASASVSKPVDADEVSPLLAQTAADADQKSPSTQAPQNQAPNIRPREDSSDAAAERPPALEPQPFRSEPASIEPVTARVIPEDPAPVLSKAEVIRSFLAERNIRWGELVAGILIVVCSIGLVVSLWSPLVQTHRVVPSIIFLAANAAIYFAGFYTLSRWRLRHTSRAVLVIATLLVPLSVLAGIAAGGTGSDILSLDDPVTLAAIAIAALVYGRLLWRGGKALSRVAYATPTMLAVGGPVAVIPLVPAAVRSFGAGAGWLVGIGSLIVAGSVATITRASSTKPRKIGPACSRARWHLLGFGGFSLAVVIGYTAFATRGFDGPTLLTIAIAAIPAMVTMACSASQIAANARSQVQSLTGAVVATVLIGASWAILPPALAQMNHLWWWACTLAASAGSAAWLLGQPRWYVLSTVPLGIAATLSSSVWLGHESWESLSFGRMIFGGEPMLTLGFLALVVGAVGYATRRRESGLWLSYSALGWTVTSVVVAAFLSVSSYSRLGVAPRWSVTAVLAVGSFAFLVSSIRLDRWSIATKIAAIVSCGCLWLSVFRPIVVSASTTIDFRESGDRWLMTLTAVALSLLLPGELVRRLPRRLVPDPKLARRSAFEFADAARAVSVACAVVACLYATVDWKLAAVVVAIHAVSLLWASTLTRSSRDVHLSQALSTLSIVIVAWGRFPDSLFRADAFSSGVAWWSWAIVFAAVTAPWLAIRQLAVARPRILRRRLGHLSHPSFRLDRATDGLALVAAVTLCALGSTHAFAALVLPVLELPWLEPTRHWILPASTLLAVAGLIGAIHWQDQSSPRSVLRRTNSLQDLVGLLFPISIVWFICDAASRLESPTSAELIIATSFAAGSLLSVWVMSRRMLSGSWVAATRLGPGLACLLVAVASAALIATSWIEPLLNSDPVSRFETLAVAVWWGMAAAIMLWHAEKSQRSTSAAFSALLFLCAIGLAIPAVSTVSIAAHVQMVAIAGFIWILAAQAWLTGGVASTSRYAVGGVTVFYVAVGLLSAVAALVWFAFDVSPLQPFLGLPGFIISALAVVQLCRAGSVDRSLIRSRLTWPIGISLLSGQMASVATDLNLLSSSNGIELIAAICVAASVASLWRFPMDRNTFAHVSVTSFALVVVHFVGAGSGGLVLLPWLALISVAVVGTMLLRVSRSSELSWQQRIIARAHCGAVIALGILLLAAGDVFNRGSTELAWTLSVCWTSLWALVWRVGSSDYAGLGWGPKQDGSGAILPDTWPAMAVAAASIVDGLVLVADGDQQFETSIVHPLVVARVIAYLLVAISTSIQAGRRYVWIPAVLLVAAVTSIASTSVAVNLDADFYTRAAWSLVAVAFLLAFVSHWLKPIAGVLARWTDDSAPTIQQRWAQSLSYATTATIGIGILALAPLIVSGQTTAELHFLIISVVLGGWTLFELANASDRNDLRHAAVSTGLISLGLWASVDFGTTGPRVLTGLMQWLVASVCAIPISVFLFPRLLGARLAVDWREALNRGAIVAGAAAGASLVAMLATEIGLHTSEGIPGVDLPRLVGVAVTLVILCLLSGSIALLTGPGMPLASQLRISDRHRIVLTVASQLIGVTAWLHLFLCNPQWTYAGMRAYWPYLVMAMAFVTVGFTEWARRRQDHVLSRTLMQTALYLPLIPVIGFWFSGLNNAGWLYHDGRVRYDILLAVGTCYYIVVAVMWKSFIPRVASVILANATWWVVLVQRESWGFLSHPQLWIIPPTACVLVIAHLYRDRIPAQALSAIRYASTLLIYISSTADMLVQEIGSNIWGPIILIMLALAGMGAGVVLRVRAFLYLGATFVLLGVTSMVWHAQKSFDAVWPWWVFGITTGLGLLVGLMAIEKNKPKLRKYVDELATWQP